MYLQIEVMSNVVGCFGGGRVSGPVDGCSQVLLGEAYLNKSRLLFFEVIVKKLSW